MSIACYRWVITCHVQEDSNHDTVIDWLKANVKKYDIQFEKAPTSPSDSGFHYQGRISLEKKLRRKGLIEFLAGGPLGGSHVEVEGDTESSTRYCHKAETRIAGPWSSADVPIYVPRHVVVEKLRPFQQDVLDSLTVRDDRGVNVLVDEVGDMGKGVLVGQARARGLARTIPAMKDMRDICAAVMDMPTSPAYFIDIPRDVNKKKMGEFWAAVEQVKNGYVYDTRYHFREKFFDAPVIWIMTNQVPEKHHLSADRWKIWRISAEYELVREWWI